MKKIIPLLLFLSCFTSVFAQEFKGQWKGQFTDNSTTFMGWGGERCDYVLELETNGNEVTGYSYTYFNDGGKRYYTICRLKGRLNKKSGYVEVTETERTKTNVPVHIRNCFQVHKLTYFKQDDVQMLEGSWVPAPNQEGDCGYGTTVLSRRVLKKNTPLFNNTTARNDKQQKKQDPKLNNIFKDKNKVTPPPVVKRDSPKTAVIPPVVKTPVNPETKILPPPVVKTNPEIKPRADINFEKRNNNLIKTIEIENETFKVDLYDNGDIDGDTISLLFNGKLILSHKRLSDKAITLNLNTDDKKDVNELVMYAENLGSIPPNTALMVVTDGGRRYEVRIASDLEKSGVIRFVHKPKSTQ
ncbi:hypothetical protein [Ferruginibacter sp.]